MAMQMQMVARGWLIYDMTGSALALAAVMASMGVPMTVFSLVGGAVTDRVSKRKLLGWTMVASAVITLGIAVLIHTGEVALWHLMLSGFFNGLVLAFQMPGRFSFVPQVVGEERLVNAVALNASSMNMTRVVAPAIAGGLIGVVGTAFVFDLMVVCYILGAFCVFVMRNPGAPIGRTHRTTVVADIKEGLRYVQRNTLVMALLSMAFISVLFGLPYQMLMPAFAGEALHVGAFGLGLLMATVGIGAVLGSLIIATVGNSRHMVRLLLGSAVLWGGMIGVFSQTTYVAIALVPLVVAGLASAVFMAINVSMIQFHSAPEMRGRVMSMFMWSFGFMPLGLIPMSIVADTVGVAEAFLGSGVLLIIATGVVFLLAPPLRREVSTPVPQVLTQETHEAIFELERGSEEK